MKLRACFVVVTFSVCGGGLNSGANSGSELKFGFHADSAAH